MRQSYENRIHAALLARQKIDDHRHRAFNVIMLFSSLFLWLTAFGNETKPVEFYNPGNALNFYYHDSLGIGHPVLIKNGKTKMYVDIPVLLFQSDNLQTPYLIFPGEQVEIKRRSNNSISFSITGNEARNNELRFFKQLVDSTGTLYDYMTYENHTNKTESLSEFTRLKSDVENKLTKRINFLSEFAKKNDICSDFKMMAANLIITTSIADKLLLFRENRDLLITNNLYQELVDAEVFELKNIAYSPLFPYLRACYTVLSIKFAPGPGFQQFFITDSTRLKDCIHFVIANFQDTPPFNFLLARCFYGAIQKNVSIPADYQQRFYELCADDTYKNIIYQHLNETPKIRFPSAKSILVSTDGTKMDLETVIAKNKNMLLYVDFWASWCAPCRMEMESSGALKSFYKGKDIKFIYISIDKNKDDWKKACLEERLDSNSFFFESFENSQFASVNRLNAIPRYMLIGKDGKTISADAPRPSDPELKKLIAKYLKE